MRMSRLALVLAASFAVMIPSQNLAAGAELTRTSQILARFDNANQWRDHVMIVAHRGGWKRNGRIVTAENSIAGVTASIALGVEIVEIDVRQSRDGEYVVMHDSWLDRTTTCRGEVIKFTVAELKTCRLVVEGTGQVTDERVSTLAEMLTVTRNCVLINIDNKLGPDHIAGMVAVARSMGMAEQVILKENIWSATRLADMRRVVTDAGPDFQFMPIVADDAVRDPGFVEAVSAAMAPRAIEMIAWRGDDPRPTLAGGPLFAPRTRAVSARGNWHLWANTYPILHKPSGYLAGGRGDEMAVADRRPEDVFGFWVDRGATIIQTDEPQAALDWLEANGYRRPYDLTN
jgi:glycerophosphoryl diester phosphodiesterase